MIPIMEEKRRALASFKTSPSKKNLETLRAARSKVQQTARCYANDYWLHHCSSIQMSTNVGSIKGMYDGVKQATGPTQYKTAPLKAATGGVITDRAKQMQHWVEHYTALYSRENIVSEAALNANEPLQTMDELDDEPTLLERHLEGWRPL